MTSQDNADENVLPVDHAALALKKERLGADDGRMAGQVDVGITKAQKTREVRP